MSDFTSEVAKYLKTPKLPKMGISLTKRDRREMPTLVSFNSLTQGNFEF